MLKKSIVLLIVFLVSFGMSCSVDTPAEDGNISISFAMVKGRTITPPDTDPAYFMVSGSGPAGASFSVGPIVTGEQINVDKLLVGQWTVTVKAFNEDDICIGSGSATAKVKSGVRTEVTVLVTANTGDGAIAAKVYYQKNPADPAVAGDFTVAGVLRPIAGGSDIPLEFVLKQDGQSDGYFETLKNVVNGYYKFILTVSRTGTGKVKTIIDMLWIVKGLTSQAAYTFKCPGSTGDIVIVPIVDLNDPIKVKIVRVPQNTEAGDGIAVERDEPLTLGAVVDVTEPVEYEWYIDGELAGTGRELVVPTNEPGEFTVTVLVMLDNMECGGSASTVVSVGICHHTIAASAGTGGSISPGGNVTVYCGDSITFTFKPDTCSVVSRIIVDGSEATMTLASQYTFTNVSVDHTIRVEFGSKPIAITTTAGTGGSIVSIDDNMIVCGTDKTYNIVPDACHTIADVLVDGTSVGAVATYTFVNVTANHAIEAKFKIKSFTIAATAGTGGTITPSGNVTVNCGASQTFNIQPASGYKITDVRVNNVSVGAVATYTFNNVTSNQTIAAVFEAGPSSYVIAASAGAGGTITPNGSVTVQSGADQSFTIKANSCYSISSVVVDGTSVGAVATYTFKSVAANHTISATFKINQYRIYVTLPSKGGTITPDYSLTVNCGGSASFTISPNQYFCISKVIVDGVSVGAPGSYTFSNVTSDHSITAEFYQCDGPTVGPITLSGSGSWNAPTDILDGVVSVSLVGGGGGGGGGCVVYPPYGGTPSGITGEAGAAGRTAGGSFTLAPGGSYGYIVGTGGYGGNNGSLQISTSGNNTVSSSSPGGAGGNTIFLSYTAAGGAGGRDSIPYGSTSPSGYSGSASGNGGSGGCYLSVGSSPAAGSAGSISITYKRKL